MTISKKQLSDACADSFAGGLAQGRHEGRQQALEEFRKSDRVEKFRKLEDCLLAIKDMMGANTQMIVTVSHILKDITK